MQAVDHHAKQYDGRISIASLISFVSGSRPPIVEDSYLINLFLSSFFIDSIRAYGLSPFKTAAPSPSMLSMALSSTFDVRLVRQL